MAEMGDTPKGVDNPKPDKVRLCFFVSAFGKTPDEQHRHKQVLKHLIQKVLQTPL